MRVLLICFDNIGDLVFTSSLVSPIKEIHPDASWTIFCKDYAADIARAFPVAANVVAADPWWSSSPGRGSGGVWAFLRAVWVVRGMKPDVIIVTSVNWRAAAIAWLVGATTRIGFDRPKSRMFLTAPIGMKDWDKTPITKSLSKLLEGAGAAVESARELPTELKPNQSIRSEVGLPDKDFVVLHPFAGDFKRCWPIGLWGQLASLIRKSGYAVVWMGRDDEIACLVEKNPEVSFDFFMARLNHGRLAITLAVTSKAKCLVGHDSGPIHFAAAMDVPVLGLYLPSCYPQTISKGRASHAVLHRSNPAELSLDDVLAALKTLLPGIFKA